MAREQHLLQLPDDVVKDRGSPGRRASAVIRVEGAGWAARSGSLYRCA